ncbi:hypothetical protein C4D60_Mb08t32270 [Musa balbisiana]|uniref:VHS domain-containing protein n=1 Tax=Musa balbisiana TaxID=52838 RepID=A0A4S8K867_MUSBA|nr:hypothetical protein C4D60_Mb08t32270 [Musa balbisiana]
MLCAQGSSDFEESVAVIVAQYLPSLLFDVAPGTTLPMATEMVSLATNEKLKEMDWMKNIEICELVSRDPGQAKDVIRTIKKRLKNKNANTQLFTVMTALGGASGKFPQYYNAYYDLVSAGVQFPQHPHVTPPTVPASKTQAKTLSAQESLFQRCENGEIQATAQLIPDSSIIHKASSVLEVLRDVLNALDPKRPEGATDEFVLDLVEQCSFQKQRVMHLVITSRDEKVITQAIELNEQLEKVLTHHDSLLSVQATTPPTSCIDQEAEDEEDAERLYRRICKGKACAEDQSEGSISSFRSIPEEKMRRPLIRPLCINSSDSDCKPLDPESKQSSLVSLPPPPARHMEREKFFKEKIRDGSGIAGHMRGLSLDSRNGSSSRSGSTDCSERDSITMKIH